MISNSDAADLVRTVLWPALHKERERIKRIDAWYRWEHEKPSIPRQATAEYRELAERAQAPWGRRVVTAVTEQLYVEGFSANGSENASAWAYWQANGFDARQMALHEAAVAYGLAYVVGLPGQSFTGESMPVLRGLDPSQMVAVYDDPAWDDWPEYALRVEQSTKAGSDQWRLWLYDTTGVTALTAGPDLDKLAVTSTLVHDLGICPVVRYANKLDLRGRANGEVEPFIPLFGRIDQTTFDRLVVQRFASFVVRTVTGMAPPDRLDGETEDQWRTRTAAILRVSDFLAADDPDTKFGSLPASPLDGFIAAHDADVRALAAVSQTPAHELVGQLANLSAEALAAAEASLTRKVEARKHTLGESHEQTLRLAAWIVGDTEGANDMASQVSWKDMESRSLAQAADALGKLATMLGVPVELLWSKVPGFTQQDVEEAKRIVDQHGGIDKLMEQLMGAAAPPNPTPAAA